MKYGRHTRAIDAAQPDKPASTLSWVLFDSTVRLAERNDSPRLLFPAVSVAAADESLREDELNPYLWRMGIRLAFSFAVTAAAIAAAYSVAR